MTAMDRDTSIGAGHSTFAETRWERIFDAQGEAASWEDVAASYWRPVYRYIRSAWKKSNEDAKDLTQEFFADALPRVIRSADPSRGSFRALLLASVKNFLRDKAKHAAATKRGGDARFVPLDLDAPGDGGDPERAFQRSWAEELLAAALDELQVGLVQRGRGRVFEVFQAYCLSGEDVSYRELAERFGVTTSDVTNYLHCARTELRRSLAARIGGYVATPAEAERELLALFAG